MVKTVRRGVGPVILAVGIVLLVLAFASSPQGPSQASLKVALQFPVEPPPVTLPYPTPGQGHRPTSTPVPTATPTPLPTVNIAVDYPRQIDTNSSSTLTLALAKTYGGQYQATVSEAGNGLSVATAIPVGTPGVPLELAFGSKYLAYGQGVLNSTRFTVAPSVQPWRPLDQSRVSWEWTLSPASTNSSGLLDVTVELDVQGFAGAKGATATRSIWGPFPLRIRTHVPPAPVTFETVTGRIMTIIGILATVILNGDKALDLWRKLRGTGSNTSASPPAASPS